MGIPLSVLVRHVCSTLFFGALLTWACARLYQRDPLLYRWMVSQSHNHPHGPEDFENTMVRAHQPAVSDGKEHSHWHTHIHDDDDDHLDDDDDDDVSGG